LAATSQQDGAELLPVLWDDNYFSLLPGEQRKITGRIPSWAVGAAKPQLELGGWNIVAPFQCKGLLAGKQTVKKGEILTITAVISDTFLDGSRVPILVDGSALACPWSWARGKQQQELSHQFCIQESGRHRISVGDRHWDVQVLP
jgi:hypothetical protein